MGSKSDQGKGHTLRVCTQCHTQQPRHNQFCQYCAFPLLEERQIGAYQIRERLGEGGMGIVYEAHNLDQGTRVAIKFLHTSYQSQPPIVHRFLREARIISQLQHPHIVATIECGQEPTFGPYLVMEYLQGQTLRELLEQTPILPWDRVFPIALQVCDAMAYAHRLQVIHRDLKPENIFLQATDAGDSVRVVDFGLARSLHSEFGKNLTQKGMLVGTPAYMAPEQLRAEDLHPATDIYALGVILFEMLSGQRPQRGEQTMELVFQRLMEEPPTLGERAARYKNTLLDEVISACLQRSIAQRIPSMPQLIELLHKADQELKGRTEISLEGVPTLSDGEWTPSRDPTNLTTLAISFVGREQEMSQIHTSLHQGEPTLVLLGPGGIGKTRLAQQYGLVHLHDFPGGVWFCNLSTAQSLEDICVAVASVLGLSLGKEDPAQYVGRLLSGRGPLLLILDNAEHLVEILDPLLKIWQQEANTAKFVVTSRVRLPHYRNVLHLEPLPLDDALQLFIERAQVASPSFVVAEKDRATLASIVRRLDGFALAIELAAARAAAQPLTQILSDLTHGLQALDASATEATTHTTMRATLDWSWNLLSSEERLALAQCSVFRGGFRWEAVGEVLSLAPLNSTLWPGDVVESLCHKSLLRQVSPERYDWFETIREYASEKLRTPGAICTASGESLTGPEAERELQLRHARYYARYGQSEYMEGLNTHVGPGRSVALQRELQNLLAGARAAEQAAHWDEAVACSCAALFVFEQLGPFARGAEFPQSLLDTAPLAAQDRARLLCYQGRLWIFAGHAEKAHQAFAQALQAARAGGDSFYEALALYEQGELYRHQGDRKAASACIEEAHRLFQALDQPSRLATCLVSLGTLQHYEGDLTQTRRYYNEALVLYRQVGNRRAEGSTIGNLGSMLHKEGLLDDALVYYQSALAICREVRNIRGESTYATNLAGLYKSQGKLKEAEQLYISVLQLQRELGHRWLEGIVLGNLGLMLLDQQRFAEAKERLQDAVALLQEVGFYPHAEGIYRAALGYILAALGHWTEAYEQLEQGEAILQKVNEPFGLGQAYVYRGKTSLLAQNVEEAQAYYNMAAQLAKQTNAGPDSELGQAMENLRLALDIASTS